MQDSKTIRALMLMLALGVTACLRGDNRAAVVAAAFDDSYEEEYGQNQTTATTVPSFTPVEGADLSARLEAASRRGRAGQTPYWSAYSFDVRPGVAVDPGIHEFHGSMNTVGDTAVFIGTTASGLTVETRNLAVFLLRTPGNNEVTRMEVYNLERKREYRGYPVYWLGRSNNEESLNYLRDLSDSAPVNLLSERAVLGISLHDDPRVASLLKDFIKTVKSQRVRSSSIYWLGQVGGEQQFLADIVRNESEDRNLRRQAAHAIGEGRDRGSLALLQTLYDTVKDVEVKRGIIRAAGNSREQPEAVAFLLKVARNDPDTQARRTAVRQMGEFESANVVEELMKIYASDTAAEVKTDVLHALAETKSPGAQSRLLNLARTEPNPDLRKRAIHVLAERGEAVVGDLINLFDSERAPEVRRTVLQSLSEIKGTQVEDKLFAVAGADGNLELRRQAIRLLGERAGKRSLDFLSSTAQNDGNTEVQIQAVRAISERNAEESVPLLIKIAKTHANELVRKQAIRALGESGDPRTVEFFRELMAK
jgi:HEAT repeat protein